MLEGSLIDPVKYFGFYLKNIEKFCSNLSKIATSPDLHLLTITLTIYHESTEDRRKWKENQLETWQYFQEKIKVVMMKMVKKKQI